MHYKRPQSEDGAAMLIVMLILLMSTATATFAIQSTGLEIRSAGHERQAAQTHYVTEAGIESALLWVDDMQPSVVAHVLATSSPPDLSAQEPNLMAGKQGYRLVLGDFAALADGQDANGDAVRNPPIDTQSDHPSLGNVPYQPSFTVDINDNYTYSGAMPGYRVDGRSSMTYMIATYTVRGQTAIPQGGAPNAKISAMNATSVGRVFARSGPISK
ncbi:MAG: pilus assembly PilX N-terminal domain-containing protein [Myxococcales bacterium]|nr:pilus assembly PilX N-terminal domain-containing protein [Myxococcales bacterium]MCB9707367.1 pilus assembly PilX N-terminal domain-containing protein [Myxococcales bacterium]